MRLLFVIDSFGSGGAQGQMVNLALGLSRRGHQVEFFIYYPQYRHFAEQVERANIPVHVFRKTHRFSPAVIWALRRQIRRGDYDGVLSFLETPNLYAEIARLGRRRPVVVVSERIVRSNITSPHVRLAKQFHRLADHVTVNSHYQRQQMEEEFPWLAHKITTIYNGIDTERFSPASPQGSRSAGSLQLLAIGTITSRKNMVGLIRALAIYRDRYGVPPLVRWVGKRDFSELGEQAFSEATQLLDDLQLTAFWEWTGERTDIPELLRAHDALVHPGFQEGLPNVVCEALACGRPVIVTNALDHSRLVQHGISGYLFDGTDPADLAQAIKQFRDLSPGERMTMGRMARAFAEKNLSLSQCVTAYEHLFSTLYASATQ